MVVVRQQQAQNIRRRVNLHDLIFTLSYFAFLLAPETPDFKNQSYYYLLPDMSRWTWLRGPVWSGPRGSIHPQTPTHMLDILIQTSNVIPCLAMASSRPIQGGTVPWSSQSQTATWTCTVHNFTGWRRRATCRSCGTPTHLLQDARHLMSPKSSIIFISKVFNHYNVCSFFLRRLVVRREYILKGYR